MPPQTGMNPSWVGGMAGGGMDGMTGRMGLDYGEAGTGSYSYATYGTGIGSPTPEELEGYGGRNGLEGGEQDPGYEQEATTTTERSFFGLKASNFFGGVDECATTEWSEWS